MKTHQKLASLLLAASCVGAFAADDYHVLARFPVGGGPARVDYLRVDPVNRHLFIAHGTIFDVLNVDTGARVGEISDVAKAHGVAVVPDLNRGFASSGNTNAVVMFDLKTLKTISVIHSTGKNPDAIEYDPDTKLVYTPNGATGNVTIIDPVAGAVVGNAVLTSGGKGSKLEAIGFDGSGRAFVNDEAMSSTHVFDLKTLKPLATWSLAPGEGGTGLAVDRDHHRIFASCANGKLIVLNSDTGKVVATPPVGEDPDAVFFDPASQQVFVPCLNGVLTIIHEDTPDSYHVVQNLVTGEGAKTGALDAGKIYLPVSQFAKDNTERPPAIPGTLEVLVVGNKK